jgi:CBS domain-containing protein
MVSQQSSAWDDIESARTRSKKRRGRRYLRVVTEPIEGSNESIDGSSEPIMAYWVDCPRRGRIGIDVCIACPEGGRIRYRGSRGPVSIECKHVSLPSKPKPKLRLVVPRPAEDALEQSPVGDLLGAAGFCVTPGLGLDQVAGFLRLREVRQVPVVDELRRPVGILSLSDIVRASAARKSGEILTVAQAMRPILHTLPTSASVRQALSLIWENRLHALVLISPRGEAAGIVGEFELLRQLESVLDAER